MRKAADLIESQFPYRNRIWIRSMDKKITNDIMDIAKDLGHEEEMEEIIILHGWKEREKRRDKESLIQWDMCLKHPIGHTWHPIWNQVYSRLPHNPYPLVDTLGYGVWGSMEFEDCAKNRYKKFAKKIIIAWKYANLETTGYNYSLVKKSVKLEFHIFFTSFKQICILNEPKSASILPAIGSVSIPSMYLAITEAAW